MNSTEICNLALSYLGDGRINSLQDDSEEGKRCAVHYDQDRQKLLLAYPWGFAKKIEKLALYTDALPGWKYAYAYPSSCIAVRFVYDEDHAQVKEQRKQDYEIMMMSEYRRAILTDVEDAYAEFTADVKDPELFSPDFADALSHQLAASLAMGLTGSANIVSWHLQMAQACIESAKYQSAIERERRTRYPHKYADIRFS